MTPEGFLAGLPLEDGRLTPSIFRRAAAHAGLASRISRRALEGIREELLPVILLLKGNDACVLMGWSEDRSKMRVLFSEAGQGVAEIEPAKLAENYTGYCIFVRPRFRFDSRAPEIRNVVKRHWFWGAMLDNLHLYRDVLLAAFLRLEAKGRLMSYIHGGSKIGVLVELLGAKADLPAKVHCDNAAVGVHLLTGFAVCVTVPASGLAETRKGHGGTPSGSDRASGCAARPACCAAWRRRGCCRPSRRWVRPVTMASTSPGCPSRAAASERGRDP